MNSRKPLAPFFLPSGSISSALHRSLPKTKHRPAQAKHPAKSKIAPPGRLVAADFGESRR